MASYFSQIYFQLQHHDSHQAPFVEDQDEQESLSNEPNGRLLDGRYVELEAYLHTDDRALTSHSISTFAPSLNVQ